MNVVKLINSTKLYDLYDQLFDYFNLAIYDLESKIDTNFDYKIIKNKLETFADNHFKSALKDFNNEMRGCSDSNHKLSGILEYWNTGRSGINLLPSYHHSKGLFIRNLTFGRHPGVVNNSASILDKGDCLW